MQTFLSFPVVALLMETRFVFLNPEEIQSKKFQKTSLVESLKNKSKKHKHQKKNIYLFPLQIETGFDFPEETAS